MGTRLTSTIDMDFEVQWLGVKRYYGNGHYQLHGQVSVHCQAVQTAAECWQIRNHKINQAFLCELKNMGRPGYKASTHVHCTRIYKNL